HEGSVTAAHYDQSRALAQYFVRVRRKGDFGRDSECRGGKLLHQHVRCLVEIPAAFRKLLGIQAQHAFLWITKRPSGLGIGLPLPLEPHAYTVEFVAFRRCHYGKGASDIGFAVREHWFADPLTLLINTDDRPSIPP